MRVLAALACVVAAAAAEVVDGPSPVLNEFTSKLRCRARADAAAPKSGIESIDQWCKDSLGGTSNVCECDAGPTRKEMACAAVRGWQSPRSYLMDGCSASTFIGNASLFVLEEAGLCPFDFLNSRFRYASSNSGTLLPELLQGTLESHQTAVFNIVPEDMDTVKPLLDVLHANGTKMVHVFRENLLDALMCRTNGGWAAGDHARKKYMLAPGRMMKELREMMQFRSLATRQMAMMGFGSVELPAEALTEYEFDNSSVGWNRSISAWRVLVRAWGVKIGDGALRRALERAGRAQRPHKSHHDTILNAEAVRQELARAGPPFSGWFRVNESSASPVSASERAAVRSSSANTSQSAAADATQSDPAPPLSRLGVHRPSRCYYNCNGNAAVTDEASADSKFASCVSVMVAVDDEYCVTNCANGYCPSDMCQCGDAAVQDTRKENAAANAALLPELASSEAPAAHALA